MMYYWQCSKQCGHCKRFQPILLAMTCSIWHLESHYPGRWIGQSGQAVWLLQSPYLMSADLWDHLKSFVYAQQCNMRDKLQNVTGAAGTMICNVPNVFQQTENSRRSRAQLRIDCNGGLFQHLL
jgi:hypothetical protein